MSLPTLYQSFIFKSRYARWLQTENRREEWDETVSRYVNFMDKHLKENFKYDMGTALSKQIFDAIYNLEVMPSMRALMTAGEALEKYHVAGYNPVAGDTQVLTKEYGLVPIASLVGKQASVTTVEGKWENASFKSYGVQPLFNVEISAKGTNPSVIQTTANHRWVLVDGTVVNTETLSKGDKIPFASTGRNHIDTTSIDYALGIQHGLVYGDGTAIYSQERVKGYHIRLCGDTAECLSYFKDHPVTYPKSANGDPVVMLYSDFAKTHSLKELPSKEETEEYLVGFMRGWLAADGWVGKNSQCGLAVGDAEILWFRQVATTLGYVIQNIYTYKDETNYGKRNKKLYCLTLDRAALTKDDFIMSRKANSFIPNTKYFTVKSVVSANISEEVFCAEVPVTNTFTLFKGIVTGNCCYVAVDHARAFDEILYILMNGTGVGFSVEQNSIDKLPIVNEHFENSSTTIVVDDSKGGWAKAFRELIAMLYAGQIPTWDLSKLRPAGARLMTFGGRSSGPVPLDNLFKFTVEKFKGAAGRKLTPLEAHDIVCKIADIVVVGGVRRSALISLSNLNDVDMQEAKSGRWWDFEGQRALANNSATYTRKPDVLTFMKEWTALVKSQSGERGIFNRDAAKRQAAKNGRRDPNHAWGTNPCSEIILRPNQFCVAGDTKLITNPYGITKIKNLVDTEVNIWNGEEWTDVTVRKTGSNQKLVRVTLSDGSYLDCTPDHRWSVKDRFQKNWSEVTADKLMDFSKYSVQVESANVKGFEDGISLKNPYTLGFVVGDGCIYRETVTCTLYGEKDFKCPILGTRAEIKRKKNYGVDSCDVYIPKDTIDCNLASVLKHDAKTMEWLAKCSRKDILEFVAGLADADGSQVPSGGIRIYLSDEDRARALQLVLTRCGIRSSVNLATPKGFVTNYGPRKKSMWYLQVTECNEIPCYRLDTSKGHKPKFKGQYQNIVSVTPLDGLHDTYCFNEPKKHKGLFGNVLTYQCNLSEIIVRNDDTYDTLAEKARIATILGTFQSTLTDFKYLRKVWKDNTEEERLLGVSMTGIMDNDNLSKEMLESLKQICITTNAFLAKDLGINPSTAITCVKPSGTVSQLVDSASGIHPRHSEYYIRTVRGDKKDPLTTFMIAKGIPNEPCVMKPNDTVIFSFPQKAPEGAITRNQLSSTRHLEEWLLFQRHWCEHKPSVTINVKDADWITVGAWVYNHFDEVSGISFLPHSDHTYQQAPYQECTKEEYEALLAKMPTAIDWSELSQYEKEDTTTGTQELACVAGVCEVV